MSFGRWTQLGLALAMSVTLGPAIRAESGRPDSQTLAAMGLGGMTVLSDDAGLAIRGHGYKGGTKSIARAWGSSHADIEIDGIPDGDAHSENGYFAEGKYKAKGKNLSFAGVAVISSKGGGGYGGGPHNGPPNGPPHGPPGGPGYGGVKIKAVVVFAGGSSSAWAF